MNLILLSLVPSSDVSCPNMSISRHQTLSSSTQCTPPHSSVLPHLTSPIVFFFFVFLSIAAGYKQTLYGSAVCLQFVVGVVVG